MTAKMPSTPFELRNALSDDADLRILGDAIAPLTAAVLIADRHGQYVAVNEAASRLTGFSQAELVRKALPDLTGAPDTDVSDVLWRAFLDQGYQSGEFSIQRQDGSSVVVRYEALANVIPGYHVSFLRPVT